MQSGEWSSPASLRVVIPAVEKKTESQEVRGGSWGTAGTVRDGHRNPHG